MGKLFKTDFIKGLIVTVLSGFISVIGQAAAGMHLPTMEEIKIAGFVSFTAGIGYLTKNLLTNSDGQFMKKEK